MAGFSLGPYPQVTASQLTVPPATCTVLLLAESADERERWLQVLGELQRLLQDAQPRPRLVYTLKEAYDNGLPLLPHALCAAIIGESHTRGTSQGRPGGGVLPVGMVLARHSHEGPCHFSVPAAMICGHSALHTCPSPPSPGHGCAGSPGWTGGLLSATPFLCLGFCFCKKISSE